MNDATRMRDGGQSWTDIADTLGISVAEAKAAVQEDKRARREALARTPEAEDRNGLRDPCGDCERKCKTQSMRRDHQDFTGACKGCSCQSYVYHERIVAGLPWWRLPKTEDPHYIDPDTKLSSYVSRQARQLGVPVKISKHGYKPWKKKAPEVQQPSLTTLTRRARKKLKQGKKLKRHYDAPKKGQWL